MHPTTDSARGEAVAAGLVERARAGDREAEGRLFEWLDARIVAAAKRRIWDQEAARDVAQETLRTALEKYRSADLSHGFLPWALAVLRNKVGNYLKRRRADAERGDGAGPGADVGAADPDLESIGLADALEQALRRATVECRRVFRLLIAGFGCEDIRREFGGEPIGTTYSRISRCRERLLRELERLEREGER
jgi:RNA polymerase sigma factor (sigma-70 family)